MKVGLFNDTFPPTIDGVANATLNYARCLTDMGCDTTVITPRYPHVVDNYDFRVYRYSSIPLPKKIGYRAGTLSPKALADLMGHKMDILHTHCPFASSLAARALTARPNKPPIVFTYHTKFDIDIDIRLKNPKFRKLTRKFVLSNINAADEVWAVSDEAGSSLRTLGYEGSYRVMKNGTDFPLGKSKVEDIDEINRIFNLNPNQLVFLFVGRMMWYKNVKLIIDALKVVADAGIDFKMFFIGDGRDRPAIEQYANNSGAAADKTIFTGSIIDREKLRAFFSRADLFLFPSTYDTSGLVVREAAACGCPSLLVKDSAASEGVVDQFSGYLTKENANSAARVIIDAAKSGGLAKAGENAQNHVYVSWHDSVQTAHDRYGEILAAWKSKNKK